ncbi:5-oxoprolinase subunit PxpA [Hwangdonia lutea]|uniref:5-oxoprolinase subunit PxpA n=1 Tax=Hwangdonia lutea TaxID=3075823 RepID=A0AA97HPY1_9FLAO|nr:5-oxoprolinase subunit PxpA [Hwangdonia sp. SCSIO 19198]WOD43127.1 5-oxoprolinase subunit PxpA [Hwangdonia sp. SCSIO 19198]
MQNFKVDINVDLGEGIGNESQLMPYISSCNIACGGHAGNTETMRAVVQLAKKHGVKIGAHPSFPDKENFGRIPMDMPSVVLYKSIKKQIRDLLNILKEEHARLYHIKPHGALYNLAAVDKKIAKTVIEAIKSIAIPVKLYVPYKSVIADVAIKNNLAIKYEAFADRNYNDDLTLVSRTHKNALITDDTALFNHVYRMISTGKVKTINDAEIVIKADTFCVHGDNLEAVNLVKTLRKNLEEKGMKIV